jgi:hypothetical protein
MITDDREGTDNFGEILLVEMQGAVVVDHDNVGTKVPYFLE